MKERKYEYEPKGVMKPSSITVISMYVLAAALVITGIFMYLTIIPDIAIIVGCCFGALFCAALGAAMGGICYYWDDERFTVCQPLVKPVTYSFGDIEHIAEDYQGITLIMKNGKRYVIALTNSGISEFLSRLRLQTRGPEFPEQQ